MTKNISNQSFSSLVQLLCVPLMTKSVIIITIEIFYINIEIDTIILFNLYLLIFLNE